MAENVNGTKSNGNGRQIIPIATLIALFVLIMGMFSFWWNSADPRERLNRIEAIQGENRKELNQVLTDLRKEMADRYVAIKQHDDLAARTKAEFEHIEKSDEQLLSKAQFEAWKVERDQLITEMRKQIEEVRHNAMPRAECEIRWVAQHKLNDEFLHRMDGLVEKTTAQEVWKNTQDRVAVLQTQLDKMREMFGSNPIDTVNHRIDQIYALYREMQQQQIELHGLNRLINPPPQQYYGGKEK